MLREYFECAAFSISNAHFSVFTPSFTILLKEDSEAVGEANAENTSSNEEKMETNMENSTIKEGNLETKTENSTGKEEKPENNTETKDCEVEVKWSEVMGQKGHRIRMKEKAERTGTDIDKNKIDLKEKDRRRTQSMMDKNKNPEKVQYSH